MRELNCKGWKITENGGGSYYANHKEYSLYFETEYKNGIYFNIKSFYDKHTNRTYTSPRYHYKLLPLVRELSFELLKNQWLWDYNNQTVAIETYKKDMKPYYIRCKKLGLTLSDFMKELYKDEE